MKEKIFNYFQDILKEMKKVTWPKQKELIDSSKIVLLTMIIFAIVVYVIDKGISGALSLIF